MQKYTPVGKCNLKCGQCIWQNGCLKKDVRDKYRVKKARV